MKHIKVLTLLLLALILFACKEHSASSTETIQTHGTGGLLGNGLVGGWMLKFYTNGKGTHFPGSMTFCLQMTSDSNFIQMQNDSVVSSHSFTSYIDTTSRLYIVLNDFAQTYYLVDTVNTDSLVFWDRKIDGNIYHYRRVF